MKKINFILSLAVICLLFSCSGNKTAPVADSLKTAAVDSTANKAAVVATDPQENLNTVVKDIVNGIRTKGDLSKLDKYVYSAIGCYENYNLPDGGSDFDHMDNLGQVGGDEAEGPGPDAFLDFENSLVKIDTSKLNLDLSRPNMNECDMAPKGTYVVQLPKPFTMLSDNYSNTASANGGSVDADRLADLKKMEAMVTDKVILNLWDNKQGSMTRVLYFAKVDKKYYLMILDLANFCDNE